MALTVLFFDPKDMSDEKLRRAMMLLRIEEAWAKLQNIDHVWSRRLPAGVTLLAVLPLDKNGRKIGHRSMDVGDIVRKEDGTLWICASCGFEQI